MEQHPLLGRVPHYVWPGQPNHDPYQYQQSFTGSTRRSQVSSSELDQHLRALSLNPEGRVYVSGDRTPLYPKSEYTGNTERDCVIPAGVPSPAANRLHLFRNTHQTQPETQIPGKRFGNGDHCKKDTKLATLSSPPTKHHPGWTPANTPSDKASSSDSSIHSYDSDEDGSYKKSFVITNDGEFQFGHRWRVPDPVSAQRVAGHNTEKVVIKSLQYSEEHKTYFTLTEKVRDFDLSISGGLSVGFRDPPALPGYNGRSRCHLPCFGCGDSPDFSEVDLSPNDPDRKGASSCRQASPRVSEGLKSPKPAHAISTPKACGPNNSREQRPTRPTSLRRKTTHKTVKSLAFGDSCDDAEDKNSPPYERQFGDPIVRPRNINNQKDDPFVRDATARPLRRMNRFNRGSVYEDSTNPWE